jgi:hypothetical protein
MTDTGWDTAEFHCYRCCATVTAATEDEFGRAVAEHRATCPQGPAAPTAAQEG